MKKRDYIVCYDISDKKRVAKVANCLEKTALRIQNSVFFLPETTKKELDMLCGRLLEIICEEDDDLRIYTVAKAGIALGCGVDLNQPLIIR